MKRGALEHALAIAEAGRLQEADGLADDAVDRAIRSRDRETLLAWVPLSVQLCDALGRPARAVHVLSVAASFLRDESAGESATSLEVDAALRATSARLDEWRPRLEQAFARVVDEGAPGWGLEAVLALCEAASALERGEWIAQGALRLARQWAQEREAMSVGQLVVFAARGLENGGRDQEALEAWTMACELASSVYAEELEAWTEHRERCAARLLSRG
jgi:hypothetical protein